MIFAFGTPHGSTRTAIVGIAAIIISPGSMKSGNILQ